MPRARSIFVLLLVTGGCSEEPPPEATGCDVPGRVAFAGVIDGTEVDEIHDGLSFVLDDNGDGGRVEITFSSSGVDRMAIEYSGAARPGEPVPARGFIDLSDSGGLSVGNCEIEGFFSSLTIDEGGRGGSFVLRGLRAEPFCGGREVVGTITGCFRDPTP